MVHGTSSDIIASPTDVDLGFAMPRALLLNTANGRKYGVRLAILAVARSRPKDGSSKEENHQCDCVTWYDKTRYDNVKAWRLHRINSLSFD